MGTIFWIAVGVVICLFLPDSIVDTLRNKIKTMYAKFRKKAGTNSISPVVEPSEDDNK